MVCVQQIASRDMMMMMSFTEGAESREDKKGRREATRPSSMRRLELVMLRVASCLRPPFADEKRCEFESIQEVSYCVVNSRKKKIPRVKMIFFPIAQQLASFTLHPRYDAGESPYGEDEVCLCVFLWRFFAQVCNRRSSRADTVACTYAFPHSHRPVLPMLFGLDADLPSESRSETN